ncbi:MAG: alpha/beta hydrolase [Nitrosospira sp.]|nr:alpha/beta hydrolase [Nitrosospira sp.]
MRMLFNFAIMIAVAYVALALVIFFAQPNLIYYPETGRNIIAEPDAVGLAYERVEISTADGEALHGWFVPAAAASGTVLFFHGNAGNISHRMEYLLMFHRLGYNTFIFDYRGYGHSSGSPSESGTYLDAEAAWRYLVEVKGILPSRITLFGESLGGAVAAWLATSVEPAGLVLASVFTSVPDMAAKIYPFLPVRLLSRFNYNTLEYLQSVTCPVFIAHSPQDEIVPFTHGRALYQAAPEPKQFLELQGGHNSGFIFMREDWVEALDGFLTATRHS